MARSLLAIAGSMIAATLSGGGPSAATPASAPLVRPSALNAPASIATHRAAPTLNARPALAAELPSAPAVRIPSAHELVIAPRGCAALGSKFDVLIHFHGAYTTTEPQLMKSGINAVYVIKNLGNGSGPYESAFSTPRLFNQELDSIRAQINRRCGGPARTIGRIALSGWSAGYGAIYQILAHPEAAARIDAVMLADGMHVGYEPGSRRVRSAAMAPYMSFGEAAARGEKLLAVTHSAIVPPGYASTTDTARFLVEHLNLAPAGEPAVEPRAGMRQTSNDERGGVHITGYAGGDKHAHCDHLYAISSTLWSRLRARWQTH